MVSPKFSKNSRSFFRNSITSSWNESTSYQKGKKMIKVGKRHRKRKALLSCDVALGQRGGKKERH